MKKKPIQESFFEVSKLNLKELISILPNKKNTILDYGCGNGCFKKNFSNKKIHLIKMYDKNIKLKKFIKDKYKKNNNIKWVKTLNENYNIVFINSTIQYLSLKKYKSLINFFFYKKVEIIIISDIPKFPYYLEALFCIFTNLKRLLISFKYLFEKNYKFYQHKNKNDLLLKNNSYDYKFCNNLNKDKLLRYTLIFNKLTN